MPLFLSTFENKVDKKGRVSVPASFRSELIEQGFNGIIAFPSLAHPAIEGWGKERMKALAGGIDTFDPFSDQRDNFANAILAEATELAFDGEGRVVLPEKLKEHAGIGETATFVGRGSTFQIWAPAAFVAAQEEAKRRAKENREVLKMKEPGA